MERKFAVVQWIEGEDSGKFSDVKTDAIRSYDDSKMDQDGNPISPYSAFIEWRHGKKPKGGWPHYKGDVLFVSGTRFENTCKLNSLLEEVERPQLTKRVSVAPSKYRGESDDSTDIETEPKKVKKSKVRADPAEDFLKTYGPGQPHSVDNHDLRKTLVELKQEVKDLKEENTKWKEMVLQDVPGLLYGMKKIMDSITPPKTTTPRLTLQGTPRSTSSSGPTPVKSPSSRLSTATSASPPIPSPTVSQSSKVEIHPGTGVMIDKIAWAYALNSNSATVFVRHLLTAVFPLEILLVSNLRGTKRSGGDTRLPLDKNKLDAIYSATLERFPGTPLSSIGTTINAKITELRSKSKTSTPHS
ncbi:hypothetical protein AALO_G00155160 [Alosa alosa]|uniref:BEN domain-containing protein n=1 Tax=Alosa alosa TaxID=278164 RepID=A0AAV6GF10_9TELE|nr:uncharacterized protein LOC125302969 [Alosa alosa]KAG5273758.1 hypothetical protein AALO_G00155160 [Alosa alosa]